MYIPEGSVLLITLLSPGDFRSKMSDSDREGRPHRGNIMMEGRTIPRENETENVSRVSAGHRSRTESFSAEWYQAMFNRSLDFCTSTVPCVVMVHFQPSPCPSTSSECPYAHAAILRRIHMRLAEKHTWSLPFFSSSIDNYCILFHLVLQYLCHVQISVY